MDYCQCEISEDEKFHRLGLEMWKYPDHLRCHRCHKPIEPPRPLTQ